MKKICFYPYILFLKIINAFKPFISKYVFFYKPTGIIKSLSGLLQNISCINNYIMNNNNKFIENPNSIIETESHTDCGLNTEKCKIQMILPGYMEHDPKNPLLKNGPKKYN